MNLVQHTKVKHKSYQGSRGVPYLKSKIRCVEVLLLEVSVSQAELKERAVSE